MKTREKILIYCCVICCVICCVASIVLAHYHYTKQVNSNTHAQVADSCSYKHFVDNSNEVIIQERKNHLELREHIVSWSLTISASVITMLVIMFSITIYNHRKELDSFEKEARKELDSFEKEAKKKIEQIINDLTEVKEKNKKDIEQKTDALDKKISEIDKEIPKDMLSPFQKVMLSANVSEKDFESSDMEDAFAKLAFLYAKEYHKEALNGLCELEKDVNYVNKSFEIHYYKGYIYGDENGQLKDYKKSKECYKECLRIDSDVVSSGGKENINTLTIYNDMGHMIMSEAEKEKSKKNKEKMYSESINYFDKSIERLKRQKIKWSNPYKNKGYCLGKIAALKSGQEQMQLYIQAFVMYQIAFALNDNFEIVKDSFDKTIEVFLNTYNLCLNTSKV